MFKIMYTWHDMRWIIKVIWHAMRRLIMITWPAERNSLYLSNNLLIAHFHSWNEESELTFFSKWIYLYCVTAQSWCEISEQDKQKMKVVYSYQAHQTLQPSGQLLCKEAFLRQNLPRVRISVYTVWHTFTVLFRSLYSFVHH